MKIILKNEVWLYCFFELLSTFLWFLSIRENLLISPLLFYKIIINYFIEEREK